MQIKKHIPNTITLLNLASGLLAVIAVFKGYYDEAFIFVCLGIFFDFWDGFLARKFKVSGELGLQLDSLADVVSFGVAPATAVFILLKEFTLFPGFLSPFQEYFPYTAFIISVFSAYRLAKFNIDDRQTTSFLGLPTPANGLFWITYVYGTHLLASSNGFYFYLTIGFILMLSLLMVSEIPMFSLKIKRLVLKGNEKQLLLIILMIAFVLFWGIIGVAWGILAYIAISVITMGKKKTIR